MTQAGIEKNDGIDPNIQWVKEIVAAQVTGLSVSTLRAHRFQRKGIPYVKIGKAVRYSIAAIEKFMSDHSILPDG